MPFDIPDRYREGRENWLFTTDTCKKVMTWTASVAPCVVSADPVRVSSMGSIMLEHIFHDVRSDSNRDDRSSRMMIGFLHQLPKVRLMSDLGITSDLHQGRHRSRSGLVHWQCPTSHEEPSAGAVFRQVVDNWRSWGFVVPSDVEQELRAIGVWSDEPAPRFLHEMIPFRKVPRDKGEVISDQELIGTVHGMISQRRQTATTRILQDVHGP